MSTGRKLAIGTLVVACLGEGFYLGDLHGRQDAHFWGAISILLGAVVGCVSIYFVFRRKAETRVRQERRLEPATVTTRSASEPKPDRKIVQALISLGYKTAEAEKAVRDIPLDTPRDEQLRVALQQMGKGN